MIVVVEESDDGHNCDSVESDCVKSSVGRELGW